MSDTVKKDDTKKGASKKDWYKPKTGNKQGKQETTNNMKPYRTGKGNKKEREAEEVADTAIKESESNPLQYYTKYTRYANDAASIPFALPVGSVFEVNLNSMVTKRTVPGIMRLCFSPTVGIAKDYTAPINRSSTRFFTYLRSNQKASGPYDHQDITMMELALDSAYMFHAMCSRIYETANAVTPINEYYVRGLLAAQCVSLADVSANMQNFRGWINQFAYNLGQFALPKGITLFDRHRWMCENYYTDGKSSKAQTYIFVPAGFWKYDNTVTTGSELAYVPFAVPSTSAGKMQYTVAELMALGDSLLNAFAGDEDFQYISGDLYNFYGGDMYSVPYLEEKALIVPTYDEVVLSQIENATIVGQFQGSPVITQNPSINSGAIIFNPTVLATGSMRKAPMNFHHDSPTPGEVIEATRLMVAFADNLDVDKNLTTIASCGTEVVNWIDIFGINPANPPAVRYNSILRAAHAVTDAIHTSVVDALTDMCNLVQFDWAPQIYILEAATAGANITQYTLLGTTWDTENFQMVDNAYLKQIHEACLWSLFEVGNNRADL